MADSLLDDIAAALGVPALTAEEQTLLLDVTREVAHTSQRRFAPLTAYLIGAAVAGSADERGAALRAAVTAVARTLPAPPAPPES